MRGRHARDGGTFALVFFVRTPFRCIYIVQSRKQEGFGAYLSDIGLWPRSMREGPEVHAKIWVWYAFICQSHVLCVPVLAMLRRRGFGIFITFITFITFFMFLLSLSKVCKQWTFVGSHTMV